MSTLASQLYVAARLCITDWKVFWQTALSKYFNLCIWMGCNVFINAYFLPKMGIDPRFGLLSLASLFAGVGIFDLLRSVIDLVIDFETDRTTQYYATLPLPAWMVFGRYIISQAVIYFCFTLAVIPLAKLLVWNLFDLRAVNWFHFLTIAAVGCLFFGSFSILITSLTHGRKQIGNVFMRFIFPFWFLGGVYFSWDIVYRTSKIFAYLDLCNPLMHISEAFRSSVMGPEGLLPFWPSISVIFMFACLFGWIGIRRLTKRLDFV